MFDVLDKAVEEINQCRAKKYKKREEEEEDKEEERDEELEVPQCDFNPILQRLKKKKINGNGLAAGEPSSGIRGSKQKIGDDPPTPHSHNALHSCYSCRETSLPPQLPLKLPTMHCFLPSLQLS